MAQFKRKSTAKAKEAEQQLVTRVLHGRLKDKQFTDAAAELEKEVSNKAPHHHLA